MSRHLDQTMTGSSHSTFWRAARYRSCVTRILLLVGAMTIALSPETVGAQVAAAGVATAGSRTASVMDTPITLEEAIRRAQASDVVYRTAAADKTIAGLDKSIALQPLSISGSKGLNVAAGIGSISLHEAM